MKPWHSCFREADGNVSAARVALILSVLIVLGTWSALSFAHGKVEDIPGGPVTVVLGSFGLKWAQQKGESDGPPPAS